MPIPPVKQLARDNDVSVSTAQRAVKLLDDWGLVRVATGRPTLVQPRPVPTVEPAEPGETVDVVGPEGSVASPKAQRPLDLEVRRLGVTVARLRTNADPADVNVLHKLLTGAVRRDGAQDDASDEYELVVRYTGNAGVVTTYVAAAP